jgi:hypothetical protein
MQTAPITRRRKTLETLIADELPELISLMHGSMVVLLVADD